MRSDTSIAPSELAALLEEEGFTLSGPPLAGLAAYLDLLMKWNTVMNLVGTSSWQNTARTLVVDSFHLAAFMPCLPLPENPACWDLGAGAGLPGIPLRLLWQAGEYTMVEIREKRALFLRTALAALKVPRTRTVRARAQDFFRTAPPANCILSRAFMPWPELLSLVAPHLAAGGLVLLLTLEDIPEENAATRGWAVCAREHYQVAGKDRYFVALEREEGRCHG